MNIVQAFDLVPTWQGGALCAFCGFIGAATVRIYDWIRGK